MTSTAVSSQKTKICQNIGTADAPSWQPVKNASAFDGFGGSAPDIDVTDFDSDAKEYRPGLQDWDTITFDINVNMKEPSHTMLLADKKARKLRLYQVTLSDGSTMAFEGYVKSFPMSGAVDNVYKAKIVVKITGDVDVTVADAA
ncbi:phage tail tube protein [Paraburkholderia sacchari]|uniref:phage tail tube protein n=1 Tax=Paraburkholderia sacchari TaxID=159450 RepID=UPI001BCFC20B|nr:phage tail tube protein [Paraburkholderia sacchari]